MPIQLRCFNNIWSFFTKVAPLLVWFLHPWLSTTNGFYRIYYQELGGQNGGAENNLGRGHLPPLAPPLAPPLIATPLLASFATEDTAKAIAKQAESKLHETAALIVAETLIPALSNFIEGL